MIKNYYEILNVKHSATSDEIKTSFRKVAFFWHPDRNSNPIAIEKMKEINEANEILSDKNKRVLYNKLYEQFFASSLTELNININSSNNLTNSYNTEVLQENLTRKYSKEIEELNNWVKNIKFSLSSFDNVLNRGLKKVDKPLENFVYYFPIVLGIIFIIVILLLNLSK